MKIAVPTTQKNMVDSHFGHCEYFSIFTIEGKNIIGSEIVQSPEGCGCKSNIALTLNQMGVKTMLAGNMGSGAVNVLNSQGIDVYRGCEGDVSKLVRNFVNGQIKDSGETCNHHNHNEPGQQCGSNN